MNAFMMYSGVYYVYTVTYTDTYVLYYACVRVCACKVLYRNCKVCMCLLYRNHACRTPCTVNFKRTVCALIYE